ncbi:recombinase family protein [Streptomyces sp. NRRL WC-3742]|uniref:recombinase family protein n=1 Tax=Streptomyces sp. NRRL WC-3742 TaxID=1463934 RepID=UPI000566B3F3|nr:recombinase family protein [Streptomyces sp. NRRL WC-3742]
MARTAGSEIRYLDLLLRKSEVVRNTAKKDILSLKAQETRGRAWGARNGYTIRRIFRENVSAYKTTVKRPDFDEAVHALLEGESHCLWAYDSSRYSRRGAGDVLKILDSPGKRLVFDINGLDTERPEDRRRIIEDAERDREYSRVLSEKVRDTKAEQRDEGKWLATVPYGLKATKKRKLKGNKWWPVVERIHYEASEGRSQRKIAAGLTADGFTAPRGGPWRATTVGKILRNPVYLGWQTVTVKGAPVIYLNSKGKKVRVFAKGFNGIPQAIWDKHRRLAAGVEMPAGFGPPRTEDQAPAENNPVAGLTWCAGGGLAEQTGHRATSNGNSFRCAAHLAGIPCKDPCTATRSGVLRVVLAEWKKRLAAADPLDPTMLAVSERWVVLSHPTESEAEAEARGQLKVAEEAVARLDRLNAAGAYPGRDGEATFVKQRLVAVADVESAREEWERLAQPLGDISVLTDPDRCTELWDSSSETFRGQLLRLAIDRVFIRKADYSGQRVTPQRLVIEWAKPRDWKPPKMGEQSAPEES